MRSRALFLPLALGGLLLATAGEAGESMTMNVTPKQAFAPVNLQVSIRIEPSADNRAILVEADGANFYRSSEVSLDGEDAPRVVTIQFRSVPGGDYDIRGILYNSQGHQRAAVRQMARVLSPTEP